MFLPPPLPLCIVLNLHILLVLRSTKCSYHQEFKLDLSYEIDHESLQKNDRAVHVTGYFTIRGDWACVTDNSQALKK